MAGEVWVVFGGIRVDISQLNFNDHSSRVAAVITTNIIMMVLVVIVVSLRLFARLHYVKQVFTDDILITLATSFTLALSSTCIAATNKGVGHHVWLFNPDTIFEQVKSCVLYLFVAQVLYNFAVALTKAAIMSSYLRLIKDRTFSIFIYITAFVVFAQWVCGVFVTIFQCRPVSGAWDFSVQKSCINYVDYLYAASAINVLTDVVLCLLPMPYFWKLHMPRKQRIILCILFIGGGGACVAGIVRIFYLGGLRVLDVTYSAVPGLNLTVIECSLGIICVSIPALRPLAGRMFPNGFRTMRASSDKSKQKSIPLSSISAKQDGTNVTTVTLQPPPTEGPGFQRLPSLEAPH